MGHAVYQVKRFTGPLDSNQKKQVRDSMDTLYHDPRVKDLDVREWHLVMPWGPTLESLAWVEQEAASRGLPTPIWHGLEQCDAWAAAYPHIVDYYFDGRQQTIREQAQKLLAAFAKSVDPDENASASLDRMQAIATSISDQDPHYTYAFATTPAPPEADPEKFITAATGKIFPTPLIACLVLRDRRLGTLCVYYKTRASEDLAPQPITVTTSTTMTKGSPEHQALEAFRTYGRAMELTGTNITVAAPGGLDGQFSSTRIRITPHDTFPRDKVRSIIVAPDGTVLAELAMTRTGLTAGPRLNPDDITGIETTFSDDHHIVTMTLSAIEGSTGDMTGACTGSIGHHPAAADALPALEFLAALHSPNRWLLASRHGPVDASTAAQIPGGVDPNEQWQVLAEVARALVVLQGHTPVELHLQDDTDYTKAIEAAAIIRSAQVQYEGAEEIAGPPEAFTDHGDHVELRRPLVVELPETTIDLGEVTYRFRGHLNEMAEHPDHGPVQTWSVVDGLVLAQHLAAR